MKQEWRKMKPITMLWSMKLFWEQRAMWVESFAFLLVHQYNSNDCIGSDGAIEPEPITKSVCNESSKRRIAFKERVKYWCDCGYYDSKRRIDFEERVKTEREIIDWEKDASKIKKWWTKCVGLSIWYCFVTHIVSLQNPHLWSCLFEFFSVIFCF